MMMNLIFVAFIGMAAAFNVGRMGSMRINKSFLEMAKKSVGDLSDAELKGKRYDAKHILPTICHHLPLSDTARAPL